MSLNRADFDQYMVPNYAPAAIVPVRGEGSRVWDQAGKEYIDFGGGIAVNSLGHCHPALVKALNEQGSKLWHISNVFTNEPALALAKTLVEHTFAERVFFCNSGAEANEAALKLARRASIEQYGEQKNKVLATYNSFHGRTFFTVSVGGQAKYSDGFGPKPGGIEHFNYNDLAGLEALIDENTACVIIEPIQGEGGVTPATKEFLQGARALCDKFNAVLIFDEVQSGNGRTGSLYAYMDFGVTPDILSTAKGLGGGFPIGAMLTTEKLAKHLVAGTHGTTYGGNPLATAVAGAAIGVITSAGVLDGVKAKAQRLRAGLQAIAAKYPIVKEIRGMGLLIGVELTADYAGKSRDVLALATQEGVMVLAAGPDVVRFAPSLVIPDADLDEGLARFEKAIARLVG